MHESARMDPCFNLTSSPSIISCSEIDVIKFCCPLFGSLHTLLRPSVFYLCILVHIFFGSFQRLLYFHLNMSCYVISLIFCIKFSNRASSPFVVGCRLRWRNQCFLEMSTSVCIWNLLIIHEIRLENLHDCCTIKLIDIHFKQRLEYLWQTGYLQKQIVFCNVM